MEHCPNHHDMPVEFVCKICQRGFCLDCMDKLKGLLLCPDCSSRNAVLKMYRDRGVQIGAHSADFEIG